MNYKTEALGNLIPSSKSPLSGYKQSCCNTETQTYNDLNKIEFSHSRATVSKECTLVPQDYQEPRFRLSSGSVILGVLSLLVWLKQALPELRQAGTRGEGRAHRRLKEPAKG